MTNIDWDDRDFYTETVRAIEAKGISRARQQPGMSDADFLAGALSALSVLGLDGMHYPASWTLGGLEVYGVKSGILVTAKAPDAPVS